MTHGLKVHRNLSRDPRMSFQQRKADSHECKVQLCTLNRLSSFRINIVDFILLALSKCSNAIETYERLEQNVSSTNAYSFRSLTSRRQIYFVFFSISIPFLSSMTRDHLPSLEKKGRWKNEQVRVEWNRKAAYRSIRSSRLLPRSKRIYAAANPRVHLFYTNFMDIG